MIFPGQVSTSAKVKVCCLLGCTGTIVVDDPHSKCTSHGSCYSTKLLFDPERRCTVCWKWLVVIMSADTLFEQNLLPQFLL